MPDSGKVHHFSDSGAARHVVAGHGWNIHYIRLGPGEYEVDARETRVGDILLYQEQFRCPAAAHGISPSDAYTLLLATGGSVRFFGEELSPARVCLFPPSSAIDAVGLPGLETLAVQVASVRLAAEAARCDVDLIEGAGARLLEPGVDRIRRLRLAMQGAFGVLGKRDSDDWRLIEEDLLALLVAVFDASSSGPADLPATMDRSAEYAISLPHRIDSRPLAELDVSAIADELGISRHHLNRCFKRHYGVSVSEYVRLRRLHEARERLQWSATAGLTVNDVARVCGFHHMGRFSLQYKELFGESPRQTVTQGADPAVGPPARQHRTLRLRGVQAGRHSGP